MVVDALWDEKISSLITTSYLLEITTSYFISLSILPIFCVQIQDQ